MDRRSAARWLCFNLLILGMPVSFLLNPLFVTYRRLLGVCGASWGAVGRRGQGT
jgi:uncharacterized protein YceK